MNLLTIFATGVNAVLPIVLLTLFGFVLRQKGFLTEEFVKVGNKLVFQYLLPIKLFLNAYKIQNFSQVPWDLVLYCLVMLLVIFALGWVTAPLATRDSRRKGVLLQATFRSNTAIIGIPLAEMLGGAEAGAVSGILTAMTIPLLNVLAVLALSLFVENEGGSGNLRRVARNVVRNPLIIGVCLGLLCTLIRNVQQSVFGRTVFTISDHLPFFYSALSQLGGISGGLALVVMGGQFSFSAAGDMGKEIVVGTLWRNVIAPAIALTGAYLLSTYTGLLTCGSVHYPAMIALFASPAAVSSAVMASQMDNDGQLATQIVVWTSVTSAVTMFSIICILIWSGLMLP